MPFKTIISYVLHKNGEKSGHKSKTKLFRYIILCQHNGCIVDIMGTEYAFS